MASAAQAKEYQVALEAANIAAANYSKMGNRTSESKCKTLSSQFGALAALPDKFDRAIDKLATSPDDGPAHQTCGLHAAAIDGDWEAAVRHWSRADEADLRRGAELELCGLNGPDERYAAAEKYYSAATRSKNDPVLLARAGYLYQLAGPGLTDAGRAQRTSQRLSAIGQQELAVLLAGTMAAPAPPPAVPGLGGGFLDPPLGDPTGGVPGGLGIPGGLGPGGLGPGGLGPGGIVPGGLGPGPGAPLSPLGPGSAGPPIAPGFGVDEQRAAAIERIIARMMERDADHDGLLSGGELSASLKRYDADGDGSVDAAELRLHLLTGARR
jgi:hypothetical protein